MCLFVAGAVHQKIKLGVSKLATSSRKIIGDAVLKIKRTGVFCLRLTPEDAYANCNRM